MEQFYEFDAPCHFGLEAVLKRELTQLGYEIVRVIDGRVTFRGTLADICRANIFLRTAERVQLCVGRFYADSFDALFEGTKALPWEDLLPKDARFWVTKASTKQAVLFSASDIQSIVKKAIVERLAAYYKIQWFPETGAAFPIRVFIHKDEVSLTLDTTGESLHKRGYRRLTAAAPVSETLAAALLMLTPWREDRILVDPFCGSGTFPIEAAMMGMHMAPGMNREFTAEAWGNLIQKHSWYEAVTEAADLIQDDSDMDIQGYDLDPEVVRIARANAREAGVDHRIHFQQRAVSDLHHPKHYGFVVTNPPYGERLSQKDELWQLYTQMGEAFARLPDWSFYVLSSYEDTPKAIGRQATKTRKIYNGMLRTCFYQFQGPKPPKRNRRTAENKGETADGADHICDGK